MGYEFPVRYMAEVLHAHGLLTSPRVDLSVQQFSDGFSNLTYLLTAEGQAWVLRTPPPGATKRGHDMTREFRVLSRLHEAFPPAPRALLLQKESAFLEAPYYVMEYKRGLVLTRQALEGSDQEVDFLALANQWLDVFVQLHKVDYRQVGLADLGHPSGYVARQVRNWFKQYQQAKTEDITEADKLGQWLQDHQPSTSDATLIHNDFKYNNIMFADPSWEKIVAVLDWEMCTLGDPLMDLGTAMAYWVTASDEAALKLALPDAVTLLPGNPTRLQVAQMYAQKSGRSLDHLTFYYVFGLFKVAVIVQQIFYRYKAGFTKDPRFAKLNYLTKLLLLKAWQVVQNKRIE